MIVVLWGLTITSILDILLCWGVTLYKIKKYKKNFKNMDFNITSSSTLSLDKKKQIYTRVRAYILIWYNSIERLNLFITAFIPSHTIRKIIYTKIFKMDIKKDAVIHYGAEIRDPWKVHIGKGSIIGDCAKLDGRSGIYIGDHVNFSTGVWIWTLQHGVNSPEFSSENEGKSVIIGDRAWVSCRSVILPGVTIGAGAVVAAGAVVTKNCEAYTIVGGVPAKKIGERNRQLVYEFDGSHMHFL